MATDNNASNANNATSAYAGLTPTQTMTGPAASSNRRRRNRQKPRNGINTADAGSNTAEKAGQKEQGQRKQQSQDRQKQKSPSPSTEQVSAPDAKNLEPSAKNDQTKRPRTRRRNRNNKIAVQPDNNGNQGADNNAKPNSESNIKGKTKNEELTEDSDNKQKSKSSRRKRGKQKFPWRRHIPEGTVDPITLDPLVSLPYPPFALVATAPYEPVPVWPVPEKDEDDKKLGSKEDIEEANRRRIEEQWSGKITTDDQAAKDGAKGIDSNTPRHYHLYDGRALAFYLVSQLQFIDPLNRRDLTRDELLGLDAYLQRHGNDRLKVVDAYDAKGVTLSSAGAAAHTAQGRAEILQQTARNLLNALFGRSSVQPAPTTARPNRQENTLQEQYAEIQRMEQERARRQEEERSMNTAAATSGSSGIYGSFTGGLMVIDDDENPGLRGDNRPRPSSALNPNAREFPPIGNAGTGSGAFYSSRYPIPSTALTAPNSFPALSEAAPTPAPTSTPASRPAPKPAAKPSKTLSWITKAVKKTSEAEMQRQWEAREAARKKEMLSKLSFGVDPRQRLLQPQLLTVPKAVENQSGISQQQLERNRSLADALGVAPSTLRQDGVAVQAASVDEFGKELQETVYSESLLSKIRNGNHMHLVLKLEKKWGVFLADASAPSLSLYPMDRVSRSIVHEYAEHYRFKTESFDPEPKRYVHCVKTMDTQKPSPLLSEAVRRPRVVPAAVIAPGTDTRTVDGIALPIRPRGVIDAPAPDAVRPKLELDPVPPRADDGDDNNDDAEKLLQRRLERERVVAERRRRAQEAKERALRTAFDSDDEESQQDSISSSSSSLWDDPEPLLVDEA